MLRDQTERTMDRELLDKVPNIFNVWADEGWEEPVIEERFDPDRTVLSLSFKKSGDKKRR